MIVPWVGISLLCFRRVSSNSVQLGRNRGSHGFIYNPVQVSNTRNIQEILPSHGPCTLHSGCSCFSDEGQLSRS